MKPVLVCLTALFTTAACGPKFPKAVDQPLPQTDKEKVVVEPQDLEGSPGKFGRTYRGHCVEDTTKNVEVNFQEDAATIQFDISSDSKVFSSPPMIMLGNGLVSQSSTVGKIGTNAIFFVDPDGTRLTFKLLSAGTLGISQSGPKAICSAAILSQN